MARSPLFDAVRRSRPGGTACPYCYHHVDGARLWYQCTGRGSPGRPGCKPSVDALRREFTGFQEPVRPSFPPPGRRPRSGKAACPACGGESGIRVCPSCHTPLPSTFGEGTSPLIALVGAKGTGKTVYLTVLAHELLNGLRRRFDADVRMTGTDPQSPLTGDIFAGRPLMTVTRPATEGRRMPAVFEWRRPVRRGHRTTFLSFYDTAGEDLGRDESAQDLLYLGAADALVVLLDPFMIAGARDLVRLPSALVSSGDPVITVLNRVTENLRRAHAVKTNKPIAVPVAVAFAKMDAFFDVLGPDHPLMRPPPASGPYDETAGEQTHEEVRALLHEWGADDVDAHLRHNYATFRYFAVSALGAQPDYATNTVDPRGIRPFRVAEPLLWLLARHDVVTRRR